MQALVKVDSVEVCGDEVRVALHTRFVSRKARRGANDVEETRDLVAALRVRVWEVAGCATLAEYLERYAGYSSRVAYERVKVALAMQELPLVEAELEAGELTYSHVRELIRIVVRETEQAWVDHTRDMTVRQVIAELDGHAQGDWPDEDRKPDEKRKGLSLQNVRPTTLAQFFELARLLEKRRGDKFVDDEDLLSSVCDVLRADTAERVEGSPDSVGVQSEPAQVWLMPDGDAYSNGTKLSDWKRELALCCGTLAGHTHDPKVRKRRKFGEKKRARIMARDGFKCCVPGCGNRHYLAIHHIVALESGGSDDASNLTVMCSSHHRLLHRGLIRIEGRAPDLVVHRATPTERRRLTLCPRGSMPPWAC